MTEQIKVLIADDEENIRKDLVRRLKFRDIAAEALPSATALLEHLNKLSPENWPTAVLIDYVLEDMQGAKLVQLLLDNYPHIPIIVISGMDLQGSIHAYGMGAYAIMQKPIDYNELKITLQELAERDEVAMRIAKDIKGITEFSCCLLWQLDRQNYPNYRITGGEGKGVDKDFIRNTIMNAKEYPRLRQLRKGKAKFYLDVSQVIDYKNKEDAMARGWVSLVSLPIIRQGRLVGWIDCYKDEVHNFKTKKRQKHQLGYLQSYAKLAGEALHAQQLTQQARVVHETNQNLAGTLQEELIYKTILEKAIATTGADCGWIYRNTIRENKIKLAAIAGQGAEKADKYRSLKAGGITGKVARTGRSLYIKNVKKKEGDFYDPKIHIKTTDLIEKSIVAVPLRRGERTLGVLTVKSNHIDFFTPEDVQLLTSLAAIAAVGMERNKLSIHLQGISRLAREATHFRPFAKYVVDAVHDLTNAVVNLWMMSDEEDEGDDYLRIVSSSQRNLIKDYGIIPSAPGSSICAQALFERHHQIVSDLQVYKGSPPFINQEALKKYDWHSFMAVPLLGKKGEYLGVISLLSKDVNKFSYDDGILIQHFANQAALALQEQRHISILQELANIGQELITALTDTKAYLRKVVKLALKISQAVNTVLYPYDPVHKNSYDIEQNVFAGDLRNPKKKLSQRPREKGLSAFIRTHEAIIVENIGKNGEIKMRVGLRESKICPPESTVYQQAAQFIRDSKFIERENIQSFIGVSLRAKEQSQKGKPMQLHEVAVLYFNFRAPKHFSPEELQVIDIFCNQVANVIHRNRLFYSLKKERELIEGVNQSALHILGERERRRRLEKIVAEAVKLLRAKGGKVYLTINGSQQDLQLLASKNLPSKLMKVGSILPKNAGLAHEVVQAKKSKIVQDYNEYQWRIKEVAHFFSAVMEVPLLFNEEVIGVLGVFDDNAKRVFTDDDVRILESFAAQAALAIYNILLYDELDALNQAGLQIAKQAGLKEIANRILSELKRVIDYDKATIQLIKAMDQPRELVAFAGYKRPGDAKVFNKPVNEDKLIKEVVESQSPKIINDTHKAKNWNKQHKATKDVRSWTCLPLIYGEKVLGLLMLDHPLPGYYTQKDIPKLKRFALQAAIGINNALIEQTALKTLSDFVRNIESLDFTKGQVFEVLINNLNTILKGKSITYTYYYIDDKYIQHNLKIDNFSWKFLNYRHKTAYWIAQEKEVKLLPDDNPELYKGNGNKLLGPIWKEGEIMGVLEVTSRKKTLDQDIKYFFSTMLGLANAAFYRIHLKVRRIEAFERRFNPYITGTPIKSPNQFYGRESIIQEILDGIYYNNYLIEDERRIGKTSVLYQIKYHLEQKIDSDVTFYPIFIDIQGTEENRFWGHLRDSIYSIEGKVRPEGVTNYNFHHFRDDLDEVLDSLASQNPMNEIRIVYLLDEVDQFKSYSSSVLQKLRKLFQEEERLKVVMAGVKINRQLDNITSPWHNQLTLVKLKALTESQARELIIKPVTGIYLYTPDAINLILAESKKKPLLIQRLCSNVVNTMLNRISQNDEVNKNIMQILPSDVENAIEVQ